jgi:hypothetical protein
LVTSYQQLSLCFAWAFICPSLLFICVRCSRSTSDPSVVGCLCYSMTSVAADASEAAPARSQRRQVRAAILPPTHHQLTHAPHSSTHARTPLTLPAERASPADKSGVRRVGRLRKTPGPTLSVSLSLPLVLSLDQGFERVCCVCIAVSDRKQHAISVSVFTAQRTIAPSPCHLFPF